MGGGSCCRGGGWHQWRRVCGTPVCHHPPLPPQPGLVLTEGQKTPGHTEGPLPGVTSHRTLTLWNSQPFSVVRIQRDSSTVGWHWSFCTFREECQRPHVHRDPTCPQRHAPCSQTPLHIPRDPSLCLHELLPYPMGLSSGHEGPSHILKVPFPMSTFPISSETPVTSPEIPSRTPLMSPETPAVPPGTPPMSLGTNIMSPGTPEESPRTHSSHKGLLPCT